MGEAMAAPNWTLEEAARAIEPNTRNDADFAFLSAVIRRLLITKYASNIVSVANVKFPELTLAPRNSRSAADAWMDGPQVTIQPSYEYEEGFDRIPAQWEVLRKTKSSFIRDSCSEDVDEVVRALLWELEMNTVHDIIDTFQSVDAETRLDLLLDYANNLPALPAKYQSAAAKELARVHECMTPVFLWFEKENGCLRIAAEVAEEAPTVKGFVSILTQAYDGAPCAEIAAVPMDLLQKLGLDGQIRMNRAVGLTAILARFRNAAQ